MKPYLMIALLVLLAMSCEDEEPAPTGPSVTIGGVDLDADYIKITQFEDSLQIYMVMGVQTIDIQTSDTIAGRYLFQQEQFKAIVVYPAILTYKNGIDVFLSTSGKLDLEKGEGGYSGTFETMAESGEGIRIEIKNGLFTDVKASSGSN